MCCEKGERNEQKVVDREITEVYIYTIVRVYPFLLIRLEVKRTQLFLAVVDVGIPFGCYAYASIFAESNIFNWLHCVATVFI